MGKVKDAMLYGGKVAMRFTESNHRYTANGLWTPSVTTFTGMVDDGKSGRLQGWAVKMVTQYIMGALMNTAQVGKMPPSAEMAREKGAMISLPAAEVAEIIAEGKKSYRKRTQKAADIGTKVHELVEGHVNGQITGEPFNFSPDQPKQVLNGFQSYLNWERTHNITYLGSELLVYSREHHYAGQADIVAVVDGEVSLIDIKTSNFLYPVYHLQTAGYVMAYNEEAEGTREAGGLGHRPIFHRYIVQLSKTDGSFSVEDLGTDITEDREAFLAARTLWKRFKEKKYD
jgi:hypothetical protein